MAGTTLDLHDVPGFVEDVMAVSISRNYVDWRNRRREKEASWEEVREYVYATDTRSTTNQKLPWKNSTTIPKLCQIRDNLIANYMATMFPRRQWWMWEGDDEESEELNKRVAIENYARHMLSHPGFKKEIQKAVLDYIDYGNCFLMPKWEDNTVDVQLSNQVGYVGPVAERINPLDIVFNPVARDFESSPKIIQTLTTLGELKERIESLSDDRPKQELEEIFNYIRNVRGNVGAFTGEIRTKNDYYKMDGFDSFQAYLGSEVVEILTFYGDLYDVQSNTLFKNHIITIVDRHKIFTKEPNESLFGTPNIYHSGWRVRQDNLWAMGPLDNLVGLQYRLDHVENMKADAMDLTVLPPLKIKGHVEDFDWGPMERIYVGDDGDVELMGPDTSVLNINIELQRIENLMEEMAGAPKEAMGFRTPGEKTKFEVQRLENAASRIFQSKIRQFEEVILEPLLNGMIEVARRHLTSQQVRVFDDELKFVTFQTIGADDITGNGRLKPIAARHFAETAEQLQNLNGFFTTPLGQDPALTVHFSTIKMAQLLEKLLDIEEHDLVQPFIRLSEQADAQRQDNVLQEQVGTEALTPAGVAQDDFDEI